MNKAGNRSWTPDEIIKNLGGRGGGIILTGWNFSSASSSPPSTPFLLPVSLLIYGLEPSLPPPITLNAVLTHHGKSICVKWNFILAQELMQFVKDVLITLSLMQEYWKKKASLKTQAGVMKMFLSFLMRAHSNWSRLGHIWWKKEKLSWEGSARWWRRAWGVL